MGTTRSVSTVRGAGQKGRKPAENYGGRRNFDLK